MNEESIKEEVNVRSGTDQGLCGRDTLTGKVTEWTVDGGSLAIGNVLHIFRALLESRKFVHELSDCVPDILRPRIRPSVHQTMTNQSLQFHTFRIVILLMCMYMVESGDHHHHLVTKAKYESGHKIPS
jgi:hypothetical protein